MYTTHPLVCQTKASLSVIQTAFFLLHKNCTKTKYHKNARQKIKITIFFCCTLSSLLVPPFPPSPCGCPGQGIECTGFLTEGVFLWLWIVRIWTGLNWNEWDYKQIIINYIKLEYNWIITGLIWTALNLFTSV